MFIKYWSSIYNINAAIKIYISDPYETEWREDQHIVFTFLEELKSSDKIQEHSISIVKSENPAQFQRLLDYIDKNTLAVRA